MGQIFKGGGIADRTFTGRPTPLFGRGTEVVDSTLGERVVTNRFWDENLGQYTYILRAPDDLDELRLTPPVAESFLSRKPA